MIAESRNGDLGGKGGGGLGKLGRPRLVDAEDLAEIGDDHVLGEIQADDPPEGSEPEQPEIEGGTRHQTEEARDSQLKAGSFHATIMGPFVGQCKGIPGKTNGRGKRKP
jgi:hypothetical protein